ncbi:YggS family pyridoxal phosphate-dependent enzyme [Thermospira aquatica]|uniref:Pyridoxal phosphate homeostasis protein n=1 Tax=Thermospira aquatica TaxID=2828656 RepID=A0AAX3BCB8_9SPIR|nr:YggS family pyridoxal phosphate-dependent enzyme [Thermospira aquatica]URA09780.1 YggS family pyridoxal phosphate-dependent enzyme [Thermospira aquatica]
MSFQENYHRICEEIEDIKSRIGVSYPITIVAVTKTFGPEVVREALVAGIQNIGENRVQEASEKFPALSDFQFTRHLIGHLQSNKINKALQLFDVIQSVDSLELAQGLEKRLSRQLPIFIEVNTSQEASKHGITPEQARDLIAQVKEMPHLHIQGLMTVGPLTNDEKLIRQSFQLLKRLRDDVQSWFSYPLGLSMGMSDDYRIAIEEGSTMLRLGRALFGSRTYT